MRYSDIELFNIGKTTLDMIKNARTFNEFCQWSMDRLQYLIEASTEVENWMDADINHLRNYRAKAIRFYEQKKVNNANIY